MIHAIFKYGSVDEIVSFEITGHGGISFDAQPAAKGNDILCAGVSSLVQGILIGLEYVAHASPKIEQKENGLLECVIGKPEGTQTKVLLKTLLLSLKQMENQFPENVKIEELR